MATVDVLNQMAEYDFNAPIEVEMIFEDSDYDDPSIQSTLTEQENVNNSNKQVPVEKSATKPRTDKQSENQTNYRSLNKSVLSLNKNSRVLQRKSSKDNERAIININKNAETRNNETVNNEERLLSTSQTNDNHEPITTFIEDLLNKLSEHIVLIMQSFYHYGVKRNNEDNKKREDVFHFIKSHFFELSYSTIESIFLPQEQNESFINQFLDNTVQIANKKALRWKCHRGHVLPFFKELMTWAKQKKDCNKTNPPPRPSNENVLLKQQLIKPLLPLNLPQSEIFANSNIATQNIQNNLCIFSSGPPGSEISINIDTNTLMQINERQQSTDTVEQNERQQSTVTVEQNGSNNENALTCDATRRKKPVASKTNRNIVKDIQKRNPQYDRPPPPAYHINHCTNTIHYRPQQNSQINMNPIRHHYDNMGPPHQIHRNIGQPINNYPTQVHYINTNYTSPPHSGSFNNLYNNTNNDNSMHPTRMETQFTSGPVISSVSSLNPKARMYNARCYMCGKRTPTPCYPYNPPCRQVYCSYLCQELDSQFYKPAWGNT